MTQRLILTGILFVHLTVIAAQTNYVFIDTSTSTQHQLWMRICPSIIAKDSAGIIVERIIEPVAGGVIIEFSNYGDSIVFCIGSFEKTDSGYLYYRSEKKRIVLKQKFKKIAKRQKLFYFHNRYDYKWHMFDMRQVLAVGGKRYRLAKYPANGTDYLFETTCDTNSKMDSVNIIMGDLIVRKFRFSEQPCNTMLRIDYKIDGHAICRDTIPLKWRSMENINELEFLGRQYKLSTKNAKLD